MMFSTSTPSELLTTSEMAEADRLSIAAGIPGTALMEQAGEAVARTCRDILASPGGRIAVLCGPGNNGGDGFVTARLLRAEGRQVEVSALAPLEALKGDAAWAAQGWAGPIVPPGLIDLDAADLIVDALFGAGLSRPIDGVAAELIEKANKSGKPIVAVDVPSGIHGDTGQVMGTAIRASATVTFFRLKPGHILLPGRARCGAVTLADIGTKAGVLDEIHPHAFLNGPLLWGAAFPEPSVEGHKYSRGHAVVVSGGMPTLGAARLAARAALRIGAGLVTVASPADALAAHAAQLTSIMLRESDGVAGLEEILGDRRKNAVVMGPGLGVGPATRRLVAAALAADGTAARAVVLDADALTSFAGDADTLAQFIADFDGKVVVTPHDGEFTRLFERAGDEFHASSKPVRARAGAAKLGAVLILKGADTVVADPEGRVSIAGADAPWLATAGSGDVLAGMVGGLMAQGMPAFGAASAAVYLHADAAAHFGPGLISEDLPEALPAALRRLLADQTTSNQVRKPPTA